MNIPAYVYMPLRHAHRAIRNALSDRTFMLRYVVVGMGNVSINFGVFWILYHFLGVWYVLASMLGFFVRFLFKFLALRFWVFGHKTREYVATHFFHFSLLEAGSYAVGLPLLIFFVQVLDLPPPAGVILTIAILYVFGMTMSQVIFRARTGER